MVVQRFFRKLKLCLFVHIICGPIYNVGMAQTSSEQLLSPAKMLGVQVGYGSHHLLNIDYDYRVSFLQVQYFRSVLRKPNWALEILVQPQFNLTRYRFSAAAPELRKGYEYGVNAGILFRRNLSEGRSSIFACLSAGPHFVSGTPRRQSSGFIFSDNLFFGFQALIKRGVYLDIRVGGRHISNANLNTPNGGVNSAFASLGLNWVIN